MKRATNKRRKRSNPTNWIAYLAALFVLLILLLGLSSIKQKSPVELIESGINWVFGNENHALSRDELKQIISVRDEQIDSLKLELENLKNASPYRTAIVSTTQNSLNMRLEPSLTSEVVVKIPDSSAVKIIYFDEEALVLDGQVGKWCKIKYADKEGWVWGNYLQLVE